MWKRMTIITKFQQLTNITCQGWCMMRRVGRGGSRRQKGSARPLGALLLFITLPVKILLLLGKGSLDGRFSLCCRFCLWSSHDDYHNDDGYFLVVMRICKCFFAFMMMKMMMKVTMLMKMMMMVMIDVVPPNSFVQLISWAFPWISLQTMKAKSSFSLLRLNFVNSSSNEHLPWSKLNVVLMGLESYSDAEVGSIMVYRCSTVKYQITLSGIILPYSFAMTISNI